MRGTCYAATRRTAKLTDTVLILMIHTTGLVISWKRRMTTSMMIRSVAGRTQRSQWARISISTGALPRFRMPSMRRPSDITVNNQRLRSRPLPQAHPSKPQNRSRPDMRLTRTPPTYLSYKSMPACGDWASETI